MSATKITACLTVNPGRPEARRQVLEGRSLTVGRQRDNALVLEDPEVGPRHLRLRREGERFLLEDLGAGRPTLVNGQRAGEVELRPGDTIRVGQTTLLFELVPALSEPAGPVAERLPAPPSAPAPVASPSRRSPALAVGALALLLGASAGLVAWEGSRHEERQQKARFDSLVAEADRHMAAREFDQAAHCLRQARAASGPELEAWFDRRLALVEQVRENQRLVREERLALHSHQWAEARALAGSRPAEAALADPAQPAAPGSMASVEQQGDQAQAEDQVAEENPSSSLEERKRRLLRSKAKETFDQAYVDKSTEPEKAIRGFNDVLLLTTPDDELHHKARKHLKNLGH